jgi:hypothetical protein
VKPFRPGLLAAATSLACAASLTAAQTPSAPAPPPVPRTAYVEDFQAHTGQASGNGSSRSGPLSRLRGARASEKADMAAGSLSGAISDQFETRGIPSQRIARGAPLPKEGWLVTGIFYALDTQTGMIQMPSFLAGQSSPPNTQVTVSVADLAVNPAAPFIVFGTVEALRGQGPPVGWNPYVVAAKFVVDRVESSADIQKLAREIVDTIMANKTIVEQKAAAQGHQGGRGLD